MYYVYILKSQKNSDKIYIGYTKDLKKRLHSHNSNNSKYSSKFSPWTLVYYESFKSSKDAYKREARLKKFDNTWKNLQRRISNSFNED